MTSETIKYNPYRSARYVISAHRLNQLPADSGYEVAFAGRSNAGKSSAINTLTDQKSLARTSKTPGRTQQIVIFDIDDERRIALEDLRRCVRSVGRKNVAVVAVGVGASP